MCTSFPVDSVIPQLFQALTEQGRAVLTASPGSGKTTRIPLALLGLLPTIEKHTFPMLPLPGTILVLEPRRLAARAAARYMAKFLGESVGQRVGYRVRLESKISSATKVELLTEGMFTRRLLADPELSGVSCVIFDEFHERSLHADLGLALCLECMTAFRPDLKLLIMSATLEAAEISRFLGNCPIIEAKGRNWPIERRHGSRELFITPASSLEEIAQKTALAVHEALHNESGSILVFLPGQAEIRRTAGLLEILPDNTDLYLLYGDLPSREQDAAIAPSPPGRRKVVLSTDLAQTSLTIEGIRIVIDAGLARNPRFDVATGLSRLITTRLTRDAAEQRAGRAGRLGPGLCIRLWPEQETLLPKARPEILDADLASLYLDALTWGSNPSLLPWLTPPPEPALRNAEDTLRLLGAVTGSDSNLRLTPHGQKLDGLPLQPRLAHMVLRAAELETDLSSLAACLAALISERDPLRQRTEKETNADIRLRLPLLRQPEYRRIRDSAAQIHGLAGLQSRFKVPSPHEEDFCGVLLSLAWPERIAQRREPGSFRLASGQGAQLPTNEPLASAPWLATATLGNGVNRRIHLAAPVTLADLLLLHGEKVTLEENVHWDNRSETVVCRAVKHLGALILEEKPLFPSPELSIRVKKEVLKGIMALGLECLPWTDELRQFQARVLMLRNLKQPRDQEENPWPDISDSALTEGLGKEPETVWLFPWLEGISRRNQFSTIDLNTALRSLLPWPLAQRLEQEAPTKISLPSGTKARIDYCPTLQNKPPVLAIKLQEMFGQTDTPRLANGQVPLMVHLLSPAGRPLQVTSDLRHFWTNAYKQVRAEMRGRYPKHPWPDDPLHTEPTAKTKKRLEATAVNPVSLSKKTYPKKS